ncbi:MAG: ATP-dependent DNA helicase RecG [Candidatus Taylorbacteria bacterium]|nr:ATP-dependent DNA helicase RecG [Candidatus Taylorbacteria bacterium]
MTFPSALEEHFRLWPPQKAALKKLGIKTIADLLYHFPSRYGDTSEMKNVANLAQGETAVVFGKISGLKMSKGFRTKISMAEGLIEDGTGKIKAVWFNQPYLAKMTAEGALVRIEGKISERKKTGELYFSNPKIETVDKLPTGVGDSLFGAAGEKHSLYPVYPESRGVTSNWIYHAVGKIFKSGILENFPDLIPKDILSKYNLPGVKTALVWIHAPQKTSDALAARKRFAFEEVFLIQLQKQRAKKEWQKNSSCSINHAEEHIKKFTSRFSFPLTSAQERAIAAILADFKKNFAMSRLLEGDVGSGKTAVAATTAYAAVTTTPRNQNFGNLQVAYMCPTEILAAQHFESFIKYFSHLPVQIALITGSGCRKFPSKVNPDGWTDISRNQLLKWVANGEIPILIGTHALIQKSVKFKNLAYVIIDEQHRFGTAQRQKLVRKDHIAPHLLSMTATPIPRTLALTIYGDLDLTLLDEMPPGRKPIITEIVLPNGREAVYEKIRMELKAGRQTFVICPRIDEPDPTKALAVQAKSAKAETKRLKEKIFPELTVAVMHSKLKDGEKEKVMDRFRNGKIDILVSTSVVEVGVNVPNATVIVIEGAERFGLAQLHQLRGRVLRSTHQAYCYVFAETNSKAVVARLDALRRAKDGFELAEYDLKFRGAGELSGRQQWGVSDIAMEALQNLKMVEAARAEAGRLIAEDETLSRYPLLAESIKTRDGEVHFE